MLTLFSLCVPMAVFCLLVLTPATKGNAICSTSIRLPSGHLNTTTVMDRLQHLKHLNLITSIHGQTSVLEGKVISNRSITPGDLWQAILCSNDSTLPVIPDTMPTSPWVLDIDRFTVRMFDHGHDLNISITARSVADLQVIPNFMVLYSVTVTVVVRLSTISQENGLISLSVEGIWRPGRKIYMVPVYAEWVGSSFSLSFPEISVWNISSLLRTVEEPVWKSVRSSATSFGLETIADLAMSAKVKNITGRNMVMLFSATGQSNVPDFGMSVTRIALVYPFLPKSKSTGSTHVITRRTSTLETVRGTPTGGAKHRGVLDASLLNPESMSSSSHLVFLTKNHRKLRRRSTKRQFAAAAGQWLQNNREVIAVIASELHSDAVSLSSLVENYTDIDISKFLPIQTASSFRGMLIASSAVLSPEAVADLGLNPLASQCGDIEEGLTAVVSVNLSLSSTTIFQIRWDPKLEARLCKSDFSSFSLTAFMTALFPSLSSQLSSLLQFNQMITIGMQQLKPVAVRYDVRQNLVAFDFKVNKVLQLLPGLTRVSLSNFTINVPLDDQRLPSFKSYVDWNLGQFRWQNLPFTISDAGIEIIWTGNTISIQEVLRKLNTNLLPSTLVTTLQKSKFLNFNIHNPFIRLYIEKSSYKFYLQLGGTASLNGGVRITLEGIVQRVRSSYPLALGLQITDISIPLLLKALTGISAFESVGFLPARTTVGLSLSNVDMADFRFKFGLLNRLRAIDGISFISEFKFPDCSGNALCQLIKSGSRDPVIVLQGNISSPCQFTLTSPLPDIAFGPITVKNAHMEFRNRETCVPDNLEYIVVIRGDVKLQLKSIKLSFTAEIRSTSTNLEMVAIFRTWYYPFGSWLGIGNGELRVKLVPNMPTLFTIGVDLEINGKKTGTRVELGLDIKNPEIGYICGKMPELDLGSLLRNFNIISSTSTLPTVIREMGFSEGVSVSYSTSAVDKELPGVCNPLPDGFALSGRFSFLGLRFLVEIMVDGLEISIQASMSPINLFDGLLKVCISRSDCKRGPALAVTLTHDPFPSFEVSISGSLLISHVLETEAKITFTSTEMITSVNAKIFLFDVSLTLSGPYDSLASGTSFRKVDASLKTNVLSWIGGKIEGLLREASKIATSIIEGLQDTLDAVTAALKKAQDWLTNKQEAVNRAKAKLSGPLNALNAAQRKVDGLCRIRSCKTWCVGCPGWDGCCTKVWGACIGCPIWRSCCAKISDLICVAANALCYTVRGAAYLLLEGAKAAYRVVLLPFDAANALLEAAKVALEVTKVPFQAAKLALEVGEKVVQVGLNLAADLVGYAVGKVIDIKSIDFSADILQLAKLKVEAGVVVVLFGQTFTPRISFSLDTEEIINVLLEKLKAGTLKILGMRKRRSVDATFWNNSIPLPGLSKSPENENNSTFANVSGHLAGSEEEIATISFYSNVTAEINQSAKDRGEARRKTVDCLAKVRSSQRDYTNVLVQPETSMPPMKLQTTTKPQSIQDQCDVLASLSKLMRNISESLRKTYTEWKHSFGKYAQQANEHQLEASLMERLRKNIRATEKSTETHIPAAVKEERDWTILMEQFHTEVREEDRLIRDISQEIVKWDRSARAQLLRFGATGGKLVLRKIDASFRQISGLPLFQYIHEQLQVLEDSSMLKNINFISRELGKKSLQKMVLLTEELMTNVSALQSNMNCTVMT